MELSNSSASVNEDAATPLSWDEDQPFTEHQLSAIDAIEAAYRSPQTSSLASLSSSSSSSSLVNKRMSSSISGREEKKPRKRRRLPDSVLSHSHSKSLAHSQGSSTVRYPPLRFGGRILYSRTTLEVEKAAAQLLQILEAKKRQRGQVTIGLDIEWRPTFIKGALPNKAAVMQLCIDSFHCHVMHIIHSGIPLSLQLLLEDSTFLKVGVGICGDACKVYRDYNVCIKDMDDLSDLANKKLGGEKWGLASLTEALVYKELQKPKKIRLGNWEVKVLSKEQLQYAATDAFASWHLYEVLKNLPDIIPDVADRKSEELESALPNKAAVMQLCIDSFHCHVMHIIHSGIPLSLQLLLEDSTFLKVGVGICGDACKAYRDYNVCIKDMDDLSDLANKKLDGEKWGLASLTEALVCKEVLENPPDIFPDVADRKSEELESLAIQ